MSSEGNRNYDNLSREFYAEVEVWKPTLWQRIKIHAAYRVKAAVRWATYWAWEDHL